MAERLALPTSVHGVAGSNSAGGEILPEPKRRFIAQSLSCSPFHRLEMTEILLKGHKTLTDPSSLIRVYTVCHSVSIFWTHYSMVEPHCSNFRIITAVFWVSQISLYGCKCLFVSFSQSTFNTKSMHLWKYMKFHRLYIHACTPCKLIVLLCHFFLSTYTAILPILLFYLYCYSTLYCYSIAILPYTAILPILLFYLYCYSTYTAMPTLSRIMMHFGFAG